MPKFTENQRQGIETATKDILVSAGAGSGKTTVLAERIIRRIENGADIKDFLVVTFTNSAAADLKAKLSEKLEALSAANRENKGIRRMLYSVSTADICTIDSFCLQHVKQNAAVLGLNEGCAVGDDALCAALKASAADSVLTTLCEEDDYTADLLLDNFASHKNDNGLINTAVELYEKLRAYPFYLSWFEGVIKAHDAERKAFTEKGFFACNAGTQVKQSIEKLLQTASYHLDLMYAYCEEEKQSVFADKVADTISTISEGLYKGYAEFCAVCAFPKITRPKGCNAEYVSAFDKCKAAIKSLSLYVRTSDRLAAEYEREGAVLKALYTYISAMDKEYTAAKREKGILDFADAEHLMLSLLLTKTDDGYVKTGLCKSVSASYSEVFIDEYQDVNPLQHTIFTAIGEGKRFMVGDAKQSIYGFRNAYPDIFTSYRDSFASVDENKSTARIFLKENFRCDETVIDFCNHVFEKNFTVESAGTDYKAEKLIFGKGSEKKTPVKVLLVENGDFETEAEHVAEEVVHLIQSGTSPKDIALLTRKLSNLNALSHALKARNVPCFASKTKTPLLKQPEVLLILSLLRVIDNPTDDISLAALLRSPIFRFSANDLLSVRRGGYCLYDDVCHAQKEATRFVKARFRLRGDVNKLHPPKQRPCLIKKAQKPLAEKCARFLETLKGYRTRALFMSVDSLISFLYEDTHVLLYAPSGREKQYKDNLYALLSLAQSVENGVFKGLGVFIDYISKLEENDSSPNAPVITQEDSVSLMTIHGSKGLEFPVVFVCGCGSRLLKADKKAAVSANYNLGISVKLANQSQAWKTSTLLRDTALKAEDERIIAEEYRLFYVAFTRAKERLYISSAIKGSAERYLARSNGEPTYYADLFLPILSKAPHESFTLSTVNAEETKPTVTVLSASAKAEASESDLILPPLKDNDVTPSRVTAKYSVSAVTRLETGLLGMNPPARIADKKPVFADGDAARGAKRGTANHVFLQFASFEKAEKSVEAEAKRLFDKGFLDSEQFSLLNLSALERFFASPLYARIKASPRVYREKRFTTRMDSALFAEGGGETVLVQGVIDCFFENENGTYTLVDYKSDAVNNGEEGALVKSYETQLYLYSLYIEKLTKKAVSEAYIYSLSLNKAIPCKLK